VGFPLENPRRMHVSNPHVGTLMAHGLRALMVRARCTGFAQRMPATSMGRRHERWTHFDPDTGIELDASVIGALWRSRRRVCAKGCVLGVVEDAWRIAVKFEGLWRCLLQGHWEVSS